MSSYPVFFYHNDTARCTRVRVSSHRTSHWLQHSALILHTDRGFYHKHGSPEIPGRDYVFSSPDALWSFGHGLSYTTFAYDHLKIDQQTDSIKVYVDVTNTGKVTSKAVPQLYVRDMQATSIEYVEIYSTCANQVVAVTDKYGNYAAKVASDDVLVFKKSGFTNVSREVNGNKTINLKMQ